MAAFLPTVPLHNSTRTLPPDEFTLDIQYNKNMINNISLKKKTDRSIEHNYTISKAYPFNTDDLELKEKYIEVFSKRNAYAKEITLKGKPAYHLMGYSVYSPIYNNAKLSQLGYYLIYSKELPLIQCNCTETEIEEIWTQIKGIGTEETQVYKTKIYTDVILLPTYVNLRLSTNKNLLLTFQPNTFSYNVTILGGSLPSQTHVTVLSRRRKIVKKGNTQYVRYKNELIKLSEARKIEKQLARNKKK